MNQPVPAPDNAGPANDQKWSGDALHLLISATVFLPLVGLVAGIAGLRSKARRGQGAALLFTTLVMLVLWFAMLFG